MPKFRKDDKVRLIKHRRYPQLVGRDGVVISVTEKIAVSSSPDMPPTKKEMVYGVRLSTGEQLHDVPEVWLEAVA
jgi:hypothetical protein